jgi:hypothetical protein
MTTNVFVAPMSIRPLGQANVTPSHFNPPRFQALYRNDTIPLTTSLYSSSFRPSTCPRTRRQTRLQTHVTGSSGNAQAYDQVIPVSHPLMDRHFVKTVLPSVVKSGRGPNLSSPGRLPCHQYTIHLLHHSNLLQIPQSTVADRIWPFDVHSDLAPNQPGLGVRKLTHGITILAWCSISMSWYEMLFIITWGGVLRPAFRILCGCLPTTHNFCGVVRIQAGLAYQFTRKTSSRWCICNCLMR